MPQPPSGPIPAPGPGPRSARPEPLSGALSASPPAAPPGGLHRLVDVPGGRIHLVEQGTGPLVLLVHGFPESWYSWRHQLPALAAAGYRAVAIDVRGYGRSSKPGDVAAYRMLAHVADNVGVVRALGEETAVIVGHDWGSPIAANSALLRPDVFTAVGLLGVPYAPRGGRGPARPSRGSAGTRSSTSATSSSPAGPRRRSSPTYAAGSRGSTPRSRPTRRPPRDGGSPYFVPRGGRMRDRFPAGPLPSWLTEADLDVYAGGVRADRADRRAQPLPQRRPRLGGSRGVGRGADHPAVAVPGRGARRLARLAGRRRRGVPHHPPRPGVLAPPRRLRPLGAAGASRGGQPAADRMAASSFEADRSNFGEDGRNLAGKTTTSC